ncbi:hypothetical protein GCM10020254_75820 [Streptomyces goshikiensis]
MSDVPLPQPARAVAATASRAAAARAVLRFGSTVLLRLVCAARCLTGLPGYGTAASARSRRRAE